MLQSAQTQSFRVREDEKRDEKKLYFTPHLHPAPETLNPTPSTLNPQP